MINLFDKISNVNKIKLLKLLEADSLIISKDSKVLSTLKNSNIIGIITSGLIHVTRTDYNGNKILIEELEENDVFGSLIFTFNSEEYEMIAKEDTKIIVIEYSRIIETTSTRYEFYNQFIQNLLLLLSNKMQEKNERIEILTKKTIRDKLLEYFRIRSKKTGSRNIYLPFTYKELADFLAVDRSAMSRELGNLKDEGLIETIGKRIVLKY